MKTIVLLGFSTAGKSYYKDKIEREFPSITTADSDKYVSKEFGHIYKIFIEKGHQPALRYIEQKENEFLQNLKVIKNLLIAAGPFLITRPSFKSFHESYNPEYIYLKRTPENIYQSLVARHNEQKQIKELFDNENFACWDENVTTKKIDNRFVLIEKDLAVKNILGHLTPLDKFYSTLAKANIIDADRLRIDKDFSEEFYNSLISRLT